MSPPSSATRQAPGTPPPGGLAAAPRRRLALVTGATGLIGGRLASELQARGWDVRCLVRNRDRASSLAGRGLEVREGDVLRPGSLRGAADDVRSPTT